MMFEDLDKFIAENPEEVLVTGGWTDDKISELEKQLSIAFREEVKIFIRKYGVLIGYGVEIVACGRNGHSRLVEDTLRFRKNGLEKKYIVIEESAKLGELILKLSDTAGIHETDDEVEKIGVDIAKKKLKNAMLVIEVFDISRELDEEDLELLEYVKKPGKKVIIVLNKSDLENVVERSQLEKYSDYVIEISAKLDEGREELQKATEKLLGIGGYDADSTIFANERQIACAERARKYLAMALESLDMGETLDAVTVMIDNGANALLELTGEKATEAVVDEVFSKFCVGK